MDPISGCVSLLTKGSSPWQAFTTINQNSCAHITAHTSWQANSFVRPANSHIQFSRYIAGTEPDLSVWINTAGITTVVVVFITHKNTQGNAVAHSPCVLYVSGEILFHIANQVCKMFHQFTYLLLFSWMLQLLNLFYKIHSLVIDLAWMKIILIIPFWNILSKD